MSTPRTAGRLNFKGDIRATVQPRTYDTEHGPMKVESASYDEEADRTTLHLVPVAVDMAPFVSEASFR
jgi:hypothetical protein